MADTREAAVRAAFREQGEWCAKLGSPFTALVCDVVAERIDGSTAIGRRLLAWPGDPRGWADGVPLRLCGGLHAMVRAGTTAELAACYPPHPKPDEDALWMVIDRVLRDDDGSLAAWLDRTPQTNEVGRGAALMAGLLVVAAQTQLPIALYELGASAGLNLMLDRYAFDLGGVAAGDPASPLKLAPEWRGPPPPAAEVRITSRRGVDLHPADPARDRERLIAYVWADQRRRLAQLEAALDIAAADPPEVMRGDAADWIEANLAARPAEAGARVVQHSVAWQYFSAETQARITKHIIEAGVAAPADAPLAWLRFEKEPEARETSLRLTLWPGGEERLLASCQAHGAWVEWFGS